MTESSEEHPSVGDSAEEIRAAIVAAGGAIPFSEFQRIALFGAHGFYTRPGGGRAGRRGASFLTSPEVGPLFGAVLARYLDAAWDELGRPAGFTVVDAGAGPGTLARAILAARPACLAAARYIGVELSAAQRTLHPAGIESRADLPERPFGGIIIANELLDNLPFRLCVFDGAWREAFVVATNGTFSEVLSAPLDPVPVALPATPAHGARAPLLAAAVEWVVDARSRLDRGRLLVVDYAEPVTSSLAGRPWREWLRTFRDHGRGDHYLTAPGSQDITVELAIDQFPSPDVVATQAQFLRRWGIAELVDEGNALWAATAAAPSVRSMAMRSRAVEAAALLDPAGLGAFSALEWSQP
jgi:SAM-dependent MidA family methyltransferase